MKQIAKMTGGTTRFAITDSVAGLELIMATVYLILGMIVSISLIGLALYLLITKGKYAGDTTGTVNSTSCTRTLTENAGRVQSCVANVRYTVDKNVYNSQIPIGEVKQPANTQIDLMYDIKNPKDVQKKNNNRKIFSWVLIGISALIIIAVWVRYYIVQSSGVGTIQP
jgi:uncharacterized membrane protein YraQ (UPF0718 family)